MAFYLPVEGNGKNKGTEGKEWNSSKESSKVIGKSPVYSWKYNVIAVLVSNR